VKVNRRFGGLCLLHLQDYTVIHAKKKTRQQANLIFQLSRWGRHVPPKLRLTLTRLRGVTSQKTKLDQVPGDRGPSQNIRVLRPTCQRSNRNQIRSGQYRQRERTQTQQSTESLHQFTETLQHTYAAKIPKRNRVDHAKKKKKIL
jgi:hypothetical protein